MRTLERALLISALGVTFGIAAASCSGDGGGVGGASVAAPARATIEVSARASKRIAELRHRHRVALVMDHDFDGNPVDKRQEPAITAGVATAFEVRADRVVTVLPVVPEELRRATRRPARVELPLRATGAVRVIDEVSGVSVSFTLRGARPAEIQVADGLALYPRATSEEMDVIQRATAEGVEDHIVFDRPPAEEQVRYDVDVSAAEGLRLVGNTIELVKNGEPVLRVAPPYIVGANQARHMASLGIEGCKFDTKGSMGEPLRAVPPEARACTFVVSWAPETRFGCVRHDGSDDCRGVVYPAVLDPYWSTTASLIQPRRYFGVATRASSTTTVFVIGGSNGTSSLALVESSSNGGAWTAQPALATAREGHIAIANADLEVLVAGGLTAGSPATPLDSAERLAPASWVSAGTMPDGARRDARAAELQSKKIIITGGNASGNFKGSTSIYTFTPPSTFSWAAGPTMNKTRSAHTLTRLSDGRVLATGGYLGGAADASAEVLSAAGTSWTMLGSSLPHAVFRHNATTVNGKVLIVGGASDLTATRTIYADATLFDPAASKLTPTTSMSQARELMALLSISGRAVAAGGRASDTNILTSAEVFDGVSKWVTIDSLSVGRYLPGASDNRVMGGSNATATHKTVDAFNLAPNGTACTAANAFLCQSGFCADGVCCNTACTQAGYGCAPSGTCKKDNGQTCSAASECTSGFCVDGTCCSSACTTTCKTCAPTGTCNTNVAKGVDDANGSPACSGTSSCDGNGACKKDNGQSCTKPDDCVSNFCVDGRCCNTACNGICQACSAAEKQDGVADGTCGPARDGKDPHNSCAQSTPSTCGLDGQCNGAGACRKWSPGTSCGATSCVGNKTSGKLCDGNGACVDSTGVDCKEYVCAGGQCKNPCANDADCSTGYRCVAQSCIAKVALGKGCTATADCAEGVCADGICCDGPCNETCQACRAELKESEMDDGTCGPVKHGLDPYDQCEDEGVLSCNQNGTCDGAGMCALYAQGTLCGNRGCMNNAPVDFICNGLGACDSELSAPCGDLACSAGECGPPCAMDEDCPAGAYCDYASAKCFVKLAIGAPCNEARTCETGFCAQGYCCISACDGECESCAVAGYEGSCTPCAATAACEGDSLKLADGGTVSCAPYRCIPGLEVCGDSCKSTVDCADDYVCSSDRECVPPSKEPTADAGCGCRVAGEPAPKSWAAGAALLLALARRRSRRLKARC